MDNNEYEIYHVINISMELMDGKSKSIGTTFYTMKAKSLTDAKKLLDGSVPKGKAAFISESSFKYPKFSYVEVVNEYVIRHTISIKKNGIIYKNPPTITENEDSSITYKRNIPEDGNKKEKKSKSKETHKIKLETKKKTSKSKKSTKSKTTRKPRTKRTEVKYIKEDD